MNALSLRCGSIERPAYAKINTYLEVLERRPDGYHELCSHMQLISLCDTLCLEVSLGEADTEVSLSLECDVSTLSCGEDNLILRAARAYLAAFSPSLRGVSMHFKLKKNIPMQGGLAGGSADAAAAFLCLNEMCGEPMSTDELCALGARLGADIPFCIRGLQGPQTARGIGERMTPSPGLDERHTLLVVLPGTAVSTPAAFRLLDERYGGEDAALRAEQNDIRYREHLSALASGELSRIAQSAFNRFEEAVFALQPQTQAIHHLVSTLGADMTLMSGSGPTIVGYFACEKEAVAAREALLEQGYVSYLCQPIV